MNRSKLYKTNTRVIETKYGLVVTNGYYMEINPPSVPKSVNHPSCTIPTEPSKYEMLIPIKPGEYRLMKENYIVVDWDNNHYSIPFINGDKGIRLHVKPAQWIEFYNEYKGDCFIVATDEYSAIQFWSYEDMTCKALLMPLNKR